MARRISSSGQPSALTPLTPLAQGLDEPGFHVTTSRDGGIAVVCVEGDMDLGSAGDLQRSLASLVDAGACCLVMDLGGVSFLDCSGVRVLLTARNLTQSRGGWLRLDSVPAGVRRILRLTATDELLNPVPDRCPRMHLT